MKPAWLLIGLLGASSAPLVASAAKPAAPAKPVTKKFDPRAEELLRRMSDYLAGLKNFQIESVAADEVVLKSGGKLQLLSDSRVSVRRPNELRSERIGPGGNMAFSYDGKQMSLYCKSQDTYGRVPAPPTIDAAIDAARERYKIDAPGADLLFSQPYDVLTENVTTGKYIGEETIDGVQVHHLLFQGKEVDWQVWIQDGPEPLPRRYVITTKTMASQPQFTVVMREWKTNANLPSSAFALQIPPSARRIEGLPAACAPSGQPAHVKQHSKGT